MQAKIRHIVLTILVMGGTIFAVLPGVASADSIGQCNLFPGNEMHSVSQWVHTLQAEGVLGQAGSKVFSEAGYNAVDGQSTKQWTEQRAVLVHSLNSYTGMDYSCKNGVLSPWKVTTNPAGTPTFAVLPPQYNKHNSSMHRTKKFSRRIRVHGHAIGFATCSNPHPGEVSFFIFVAPKHHKAKPKPKPAPAQVNECHAGQVIASNGNCVNQSNTSSETCGNGQVQSATGCVTIQINNVCGEVSVGGSTGGGEQCKIEVVEEKPCECHEPPPPPPPVPCELTNLRKLEPKDGGEATRPGATTPITVELICSPGDSVLLTFHDEFGHFEKSTETVTSPGKYQETLIVPEASGIESDTYWVSALDLKTGQKFETEHWTYAIEAAPFL